MPLECTTNAFTKARLLGGYTRNALAPAQQRHYGKLTLSLHFTGGASFTVCGMLGLLAYEAYPGRQLAAACTWLFGGWCGLAALTSLFMARYTQGHKAALLLGYMSHALMWALAGTRMLQDPSAPTVYVARILGQAFATCRLCVLAGSSLQLCTARWSYTIGATAGSTVCILLAHGLRAGATVLVVHCGVPVLFGGAAAKWHVHFNDKSDGTKMDVATKQGIFEPFAYPRRLRRA